MIPASRADAYRLALVRHAYRMLGERAEAEDAVQDAYVRRHQAATRAPIADDLAFLRVTVTRLCLDRLRSARARREAYVGPWLPEPLIGRRDDDPAAHAAFADDVSFALLLALERLSALERAAFLLHDVMGVPFAEVAQTLRRTEDAVKRLASRAACTCAVRSGGVSVPQTHSRFVTHSRTRSRAVMSTRFRDC